MKKDSKTKYQLLNELFELSQRVAELEKLEAEHKLADEILSESEIRYRRMVDAVTPYTYSVVVKEGRAVSTRHSAGCVAVTGYNSQDYEKDPNLWYSMIHAEDRKSVEGAVRKIMSGNDILPIEHRLIRRDGTVVWVRNTMIPYRDESGLLHRYDGLIENITERKKMEDEVLKARKLESVGTLAGGIAHDFNNLLHAILGSISLAKMHAGPDDKIYKLLDTAEQVSLRASDITRQLITFARGGAPVLRTMYIGEMIKNCVHFFLGNSSVTAKFQIASDLTPIDIDEGQIKQVIHSLVANAVEAMPDGGTLAATVENVDVEEAGEAGELPLGEGKYVRVTLADTGRGIPHENVSRIFDPFFTTKEMGAQKGTGLGLAIAYSIVKSHNGSIVVESKEGMGTTFRIYLPSSKTCLAKEGSDQEDIAAASSNPDTT
ncbi:MAG TPA: ATP-binding protein [Syntrophales bacterium]|nr:ATP-binding protein [Syntrophales bacterium]